MDEEIQLREREIVMKVEALDAQRHQHAHSLRQRRPPSPPGAAGKPSSSSSSRGRTGYTSPRSTKIFAHMNDGGHENEDDGDRGTPLEFTPKALRRQSPAKQSTADSARAGVQKSGGAAMGDSDSAPDSPFKYQHRSMRSESAVNHGERPPLFVGRAPPASPNKVAQRVAEAVVMAAVGSQRRGADEAGSGGGGPAHALSPSRSKQAKPLGLLAGGAGGTECMPGASQHAKLDCPSKSPARNAPLQVGGKKPGEKGYWQVCVSVCVNMRAWLRALC
jgi:hypothetical protein